ncbi:hypothetical protein ART_1498 [Arthrobacter sp. PAMC 25486]|nr:hypothetical protein ART_1498 [Arthrobacter sp. PAMC 25486]
MTGLRWFPTGLLIPVYALLPLHRGLSIAEFGAVVAVQGFVVLFLELPTGGLADSLGRRPLMVTSALVALASYATFAFAGTFAWFLAASALSGVFRALDSGPLNAWFVDQTLASGEGGSVAKGISGAGAVVGTSMALGAVAAGGLVAWHPFAAIDALATPFLVAAALTLVQIGTTLVLMRESRPAHSLTFRSSIRAIPRTIVAGAQLAVGNRVLRALLAASVFLGFGVVGLEQFMPIRLSELLGNPDMAGVVMGPVSAAAWGISAIGAAAVPLLLRRWSMPAVSIALVIGEGAMVVVMGLAAGPAGLILAFFCTYAVHTAFGAIYETMLHGQVSSSHRATVLSLSSMVFQPAGSLGALVLGLIATGVSSGMALVVAGVVFGCAAPLFLVKTAPHPIRSGTGTGRCGFHPR